ncbi:unnamed protein product [Rhodiola kirilowii]
MWFEVSKRRWWWGSIQFGVYRRLGCSETINRLRPAELTSSEREGFLFRKFEL